MEIVIGAGVGELLFGVTEAKAKEIFGLGDKLYETDSGCRRLQFNEAMLELSFEPDNDGLLGWVEVHNPKAKLFGHLLVGESRQAVLDLLKADLGQPSEYADYGSFDTVFYEEQWLELHFKFGRLTNLNLGVLYSEDDEPMWPA
jgi:hypothetical protein